MAQYDGAIRIITKITTKDAKESLHSLEYTIKKSAKEIDSLRAKMDALKNQKIPTKEWKELEKELSDAKSNLEKLIAKQTEWESLGVTSGGAWDSLNEEIANASDKVDLIKEKMQSLTDAGKNFTLGKDTEEYKSYERQIGYEEKAIAEAGRHYKALLRTKDGYEKLKNSALSAVQKIGNAVKKSAIDPLKSLGTFAGRTFLGIGKSAKSSASGIQNFGKRIKGLVLSALIFNQVSKLFNAMISGMRQGFENFYNQNANFRSAIDGLKASLSTLGNSMAAAFAPIVQIAIPYIQQLIGWITSVINLIGQFIGAITGQKTYTRAVQQSAGAMQDAAGAASDAGKALEGYLSPLDEINKLDTDSSSGGGGGGGGGGGAGGALFEEVPIDDNISKMADKFKDIMSQLFAPLKEAWEREGQFVMDSWKFALQETWNLMKDIGRDFLTMWNEEATIQMFSDLLHIVGDIGLVAGNLAERFREAWNTNDVGLHILENIRDIFAIIIGHIRSAADYTVEWSKKLDFYPLLESINGLLEALKPLTDNIGSGLEWFYKNVLLPVAGWTIQEAIPTFLDMLSAAISALNKVITALQPLGQWLWENFLQPLGQWAGETIIDAMQTITDLLTRFGNWVSEHQGAVQNMTIIIGSFFAAFKIVTAVAGIVNFIAKMGGLIGIVQKMAGLIGTVFNPWTLAIGAVIAIGVLLWKNWDTIKEKAIEIWGAIRDWFKETIEKIKGFFSGLWKGIKETFANVGGWFKEKFEAAKDNIYAAFKNIGNWFGNRYKDIINAFSGVKDWFRNAFSEAWKAVNDVFSNVKSSMYNVGMNIINGIIDGIKAAWNALTSWASSIISMFSISVNPSSSGTSASSSSKAASRSLARSYQNPAFAGIDTSQIPGYATGQVIPARMKQHLAILGDNNRETEVVSPLSTIRQALREEATSLGLGGGAANGNMTLNVYLHDDQLMNSKKIFEAVIKQGKIEQMSSGKNRLLLEN